jgi:hypothetical protein
MEFTWENILICEVEAQSPPKPTENDTKANSSIGYFTVFTPRQRHPFAATRVLVTIGMSVTICDTLFLLHDLHLQDRVHSLLQRPLSPEILYVLHQSVVL